MLRHKRGFKIIAIGIVVLLIMTSFQLNESKQALGQTSSNLMPWVKSVNASRASFSMVRSKEGIYFAWGNNSGALGDGSSIDHHRPVKVNGLDLGDEVVLGGRHILALGLDGTVKSWGSNGFKQLGRSTGDEYFSGEPGKIEGISDVVALAAGEEHSLALKGDGSVWGWGKNTVGELGIGSLTDMEASPIQVKGLEDVIGIAAGWGFSAALKSDGTVWMWGMTFFTIPGRDDHIFTSPVQIQNLTNIIAISVGDGHLLALKNDGTVWSWGYNNRGQLGNGNTTNQLAGVQVRGINDVIKVEAGGEDSFAIKSDGTVWAWGTNHLNQLGTGSKKMYETIPQKVLELENVKEVAAGYSHNIALTSDEKLYVWGTNISGELGDGTTVHRPTPIRIFLDGPVTYRLAGSNRLETAAEISKQGWNYYANDVILARDDNFPDALAGTPLSEGIKPILLTNSKKLSHETKAELDRLYPTNIIILGGTGAISADIEIELKQNYRVTRLGGDDRYETSAKIAEYLIQHNTSDEGAYTKAIIANGGNFPDALAAAAPASYKRMPIFLSDGKTISKPIKEVMEKYNIEPSVIVGGLKAVSEELERQFPDVVRYGGEDRYETAIKVAQGMDTDIQQIFLATGTNFPDALVGSALASRTNSPVILVNDQLPKRINDLLMNKNKEVKVIFALGGSQAVPESVIQQLLEKVSD